MKVYHFHCKLIPAIILIKYDEELSLLEYLLSTDDNKDIKLYGCIDEGKTLELGKCCLITNPDPCDELRDITKDVGATLLDKLTTSVINTIIEFRLKDLMPESIYDILTDYNYSYYDTQPKKIDSIINNSHYTELYNLIKKMFKY